MGHPDSKSERAFEMTALEPTSMNFICIKIKKIWCQAFKAWMQAVSEKVAEVGGKLILSVTGVTVDIYIRDTLGNDSSGGSASVDRDELRCEENQKWTVPETQ